jgi:hypothetical protein
MIKKSKETANGSRDNEGPQFRDNPEINAKIDDYIKQNPKHWSYIQSMPPERMARALVLNEVQRRDRTQNMRKGILRKLEQDPELKQAYQTLVKNLPEDHRGAHHAQHRTTESAGSRRKGLKYLSLPQMKTSVLHALGYAFAFRTKDFPVSPLRIR